MNKTVNVGFSNIVMTDRIVAMVSSEGNPAKRLVSNARENGNLVDATHGRKTRTLLIMDNGSVVLSALLPDTIAARLEAGQRG